MMEKLLRHGANSAISPNMIGGLRLASELIRPGVVNFLDLMLRNQSGTLRVEEITVAGNLKEIFFNISEIGNDLEFRGAMACPTIRVEGLTVGGE